MRTGGLLPQTRCLATSPGRDRPEGTDLSTCAGDEKHSGNVRYVLRGSLSSRQAADRAGNAHAWPLGPTPRSVVASVTKERSPDEIFRNRLTLWRRTFSRREGELNQQSSGGPCIPSGARDDVCREGPGDRRCLEGSGAGCQSRGTDTRNRGDCCRQVPDHRSDSGHVAESTASVPQARVAARFRRRGACAVAGGGSRGSVSTAPASAIPRRLARVL
jgi:hypothetical protein